jgi:hypothetical protein
MPVNVGEIVSDVIPEPEASASGGGSEPEWQRAARLRALEAWLRRDRLRTAAEGFDD